MGEKRGEGEGEGEEDEGESESKEGGGDESTEEGEEGGECERECVAVSNRRWATEGADLSRPSYISLEDQSEMTAFMRYWTPSMVMVPGRA